MRFWRWMAGVAGACVLAACGADRVTGLRQAVPVGLASQAVSAGTGGVAVTLRYKGDTLSAGTTGCGGFTISVVDSASGQQVAGTGGVSTCGTWTAPSVPAGAYRARVNFRPYTPGVPAPYGPADLVVTDVFHVTAGETAPLFVELGAAVGQVRGQVLVNGQPPLYANIELSSTRASTTGGPTWRYADYFSTTNTAQGGVPAGSFVHLIPAGTLGGTVSLSYPSYAQVGLPARAVAAGQTTELGNVTPGDAAVAVTLRYKGDTLSAGTTGCGSFAISLVDTAQGQQVVGTSTASLCGTWTAPVVPAGTYRVRVRYQPYGQTPAGPSAQFDLATSGVFTVASGQTARVALELGDKVGQVKGQVLLNGQPPSNFVSVYLRVVPAGAPAASYYDYASVTNYVVQGVPAGSFVRLVPAGSLTATARLTSSSSAEIGSAAATVAAGATTDLGNLSGGSGALLVTLRYKGQALDPAATGCGMFDISVVDSATGQRVTGNGGNSLCGVFAVPAVPAGTYRVRLGYFPYASNIPPGSPGYYGPPDLAVSSVIHVRVGDTTRVEFEVGDKVGQVKGRALVNGQPPAYASVVLQSATQPGAGGQSWTYSDYSSVTNYAQNGLAAGVYLRLLPAGRLAGTVSLGLNTQIETISGVVVAGQLTVVGQPSVLQAAADVQPETISMSRTSTVTVYLLSDYYLDARQADPASARLRVVGGRGSAAVAKRGTAPMTSVVDVNRDGMPDRMFVFLRSELAAAGLSPTRAQLVLEDLTGYVRYAATDAAPPRVVK